jgi:cytochrome b561
MVQGILAVSGQSVFADVSTHNKRTYSHWVFQTLALVLITIGQSSIFVNKNKNGYPHYQTIHSFFGLVTYIGTVFGSLGGVANLYSNSLKSFIKPVQLKVGHAMAGSVLYVVAVVTICLGINQTWTNESDAQLRLATMSILLISSFYVVTKSIKTALSRLSSMSKK